MNIWLAEIWRAWRASFRKPGFLLLATGVLALGIGSTAAVFTLVDQVLLQPLPVADASRLVMLGRLRPSGHVGSISPQRYQQLSAVSGVTSTGLVGMAASTTNIAGGGPPLQVPVIYADRGLLPTLGVHLALGNNFSAAEDRPHGPSAVILSHGFWQRRFGGNKAVVGQIMQVEGVAHTIIGVLPASFSTLGFGGDILLPTAFPANSKDRGANYLAIARIADGVSAATVAAQVNTRLHAIYDAQGDANWRQKIFSAESLKASLHAQTQPVLILFLVSALFVMLIALVNLANLMLLRALSRSHDAAVRGALGATRFRLVLPALADGLLVGLAGALAGLALAEFGLVVLQRFMPAEWLAADGLGIGAPAWALALALGLLGAMMSALLGLWRSRAATSVQELREGGRSGIGVHTGRLSRVLVVAQMALATVLLSAAGLLLHTLYGAAQTPIGFSTQGILTFELAPVKAEYPDSASVQMLASRLTERLRAVPGVLDATATTNLPAGDFNGQFQTSAQNAPGGDAFVTQIHGVDHGFFKLFGIDLHEGRTFTRDDVGGSERVAVISTNLAKRYYGGRALGKLVYLDTGGSTNLSLRIVGTVSDTSQRGPLTDKPLMVYMPLTQVPDSVLSIFRRFQPMRFAVSVKGNPQEYRNVMRKAVAEVAPGQPIANVRSMRSIVQATTSGMRLNLLLVGIFASLSLLLAAAGMYAVMAVVVAAREREFGVRTALGASPSRLLRLVMRGGLLQVGIGLVLGVGVAWALSGVLAAVMQQIGRDSRFAPLTIGGVCAVLAITGLLACLIPALRAARVQPMHALRGE